MANFIRLPDFDTNPTRLDLSPVQNALAGYSKGVEQQYKGDTARQIGSLYGRGDMAGAQRVAAERGELDTALGLERAQREKETAAREGFKAKAQMFGNLIESHVMDPKITPQERAVRWQQIQDGPLKGDTHLDDPKYGAMIKDPVLGPQMFLKMIQPYRDPLAKRLMESQASENEANTQYKKAMAAQAGAKSPLIKDGDKPLVVIEPDADGKMGAREIYGGSQGNNTQKNLEGGFRELFSILERYGGDKGVFGHAVGPFQGDPNGYVLGPVARAVGSAASFGATGPNAEAPPSEVRRAIEGATATLAASLKPLIRKPGEGSWSDRDQAVLDSIVGNLTRTKTVEQYDRELNNVRLRIKSNFNIDLPELVRKANTDRAPTAQSNPAPKQAPDGKFYVPDPNRPGKYLRVEH